MCVLCLGRTAAEQFVSLWYLVFHLQVDEACRRAWYFLRRGLAEPAISIVTIAIKLLEDCYRINCRSQYSPLFSFASAVVDSTRRYLSVKDTVSCRDPAPLPNFGRRSCGLE